MKRKRFGLMTILVILCMCFLPLTVWAGDERIQALDTEVVLRSDGSARITQTWQLVGLDEGTEYYTEITKSGGLVVSDLQVQDETGRRFETQTDWDLDRTLEEKAFQCGIVETADGYELCWGIGSYGDHTYTVQYDLAGLVKVYTDEAGFYHRFIDSQLVEIMDQASVTIVMDQVAFTADNARIWALSFDSFIGFEENGSIRAYNEREFEDWQSVRVMCAFDAGLFPDAQRGDGTFADVIDTALEVGRGDEVEWEGGTLVISSGSDTFQILLLILGAMVVLTGVVVLTVYVSGHITLEDGTRIKIPKWKEVEPRSGLPFGGSIVAAYYGLQVLRQPLAGGEIFGAYLIKWENDGWLRMEDQSQGKKKKPKTVLIFSEGMPSYASYEQELYGMIRNLTDENRQLTQKKFQKWTEKHYDQILEWEKKLAAIGKKEMKEMGYIRADEKGKQRFTQAGFEQLTALLGLHRYLQEYTDHYLKNEEEHELWGDYLIYAILFGINEQFIVDLQQADPGYFDEFCIYYGYQPYMMQSMFIMTHQMSQTAVHAAHGSDSAFDGGGGSSSFSGGGGFTGGGGGGSR